MQMLLNDRYQVIRTLGGGGFGETFLAEDTQMPSQRRCVVKLLRPIQNNPQIYQLVQERFQREAAILEDLGGATDQIPTLYAYFQSEGQFYLVQEYVEGDTLTAKIHQQGLFSEGAIRELLGHLLPVLEYVHNKRIVHRDIKPDNIILRHRDGKPVLIDFGAVRESMGTVVNSQGNPTSSIVIGTPGYMSSEQAAGRPVYSSDLYSLGMTAIYLLTGKQPQELETDPRMGEVIWHRHALSISPTMAGLIDKAIAYHPRERFFTAREMLETLQTGIFPANPTVPVSPPTVPHYSQPQPPTAPPPITPQNTVAVSPAYSPQPVNQPSQNNGSKGMVLAALIAGGLVSASVIIGFALTRQPQKIAEQSTSRQQEPQDNQPAETVTKQQEPQETQETSPIKTSPQREAPNTVDKPPTVDNNEPIVKTPVIKASPTPETAQSPSSESSSNTSPTVDKVSAEQAVQSYYSTINQGEFQTAWNQLSPNFQNNKRLHPNGYLSYVDWWGGQVQNVDVEQVSFAGGTAEQATVNAQLKYSLKTGKVVSSSVRFSLLWDAGSNKWVIADAK
jgi:serine/threonine protein kinase, bacterial